MIEKQMIYKHNAMVCKRDSWLALAEQCIQTRYGCSVHPDGGVRSIMIKNNQLCYLS